MHPAKPLSDITNTHAHINIADVAIQTKCREKIFPTNPVLEALGRGGGRVALAMSRMNMLTCAMASVLRSENCRAIVDTRGQGSSRDGNACNVPGFDEKRWVRWWGGSAAQKVNFFLAVWGLYLLAPLTSRQNCVVVDRGKSFICRGGKKVILAICH